MMGVRPQQIPPRVAPTAKRLAQRCTSVGLGLAAEYTAQQAIRSPDVNWLHVMVEVENEASIALLIDGWHMWESQRGKLLKIGGAICVLIPGTATYRVSPLFSAVITPFSMTTTRLFQGATTPTSRQD